MKGKNMKRCFNDTKIALSSMIIMLCLVLPGCDLFKKNEEEKRALGHEQVSQSTDLQEEK